MVVVLLAVLAAPFGVLFWAAQDGTDRLPEGTRIGGVDVGGLDRATAVARLRAQIGTPLDRAVKIEVDGGTRRIGPEGAGVELGIADAVDEAVAFGARGNFLLRGWRELTGSEVASTAPVRIAVDKDQVRRFVDRIAADVAVAPKEAELAITLESVSVSESTPGQELADPDALADDIVRALKSPDASRELTASTTKVEPTVTADSIFDANPIVVTVARDSTTVRVFDRGELTTTYGVAVGEPNYPTPVGTYTVQSMQVDPVWNVPNSSWAGELAGTTVAGGTAENPLKERWIGFNGSVGFHGTADVGSLGSAASHGCVRMAPADVIDLYERVQVGTPVYVA